MANREALRELQTRLAGRLQAAGEGVSMSSWLAVQAAGKHYLMPLGQSGEIFPWPGVQTVPYTQPWFLGVANLRGALVGVVDLAAFLGHGVVRTEQSLSDTSLLALNAALEVKAALLVDRLLGLRHAQSFPIVEPPAADAPTYLGSVYVDEQGQRWQELQLQLLAQHPAFLGVGT